MQKLKDNWLSVGHAAVIIVALFSGVLAVNGHLDSALSKALKPIEDRLSVLEDHMAVVKAQVTDLQLEAAQARGERIGKREAMQNKKED